MSGILRFQAANLRKLLPQLQRRLISTSGKNSENAVATTTESTDCKSTKRNWISYGYEESSEEADLNAMHSTMFAFVTCCLVFGGFYIAYTPDDDLNDWAQREAFLELKRREDAGLPLIDPNLIDPSKIYLPTDDELGDTEIII